MIRGSHFRSEYRAVSRVRRQVTVRNDAPQFAATGANDFLDLLPLALWSALYPTLLAMVVLIMQRPSPRRMLVTCYVGGLVASLTAGFLLIGVFDAGDSLGASDRTVSPTVDIAVGLLTLALFWVLVSGRDRGFPRERRAHKKEGRSGERENRAPWSRRMMQRDSLGLTFAVAFVLNLPGAAYLVALKDIAESSAGTARTVSLDRPLQPDHVRAGGGPDPRLHVRS